MQASRATRSPEPGAAAFVRGRDATKRGGRLPGVAATARAPLPSALRCAPAACRSPRAGLGGVALVGAPSLDLAQPALSAPALPYGRDFFSFPLFLCPPSSEGDCPEDARRGKVRAVCPGSLRRHLGRIVAGQAKLGLDTARALQVGQRRRGLGGRRLHLQSYGPGDDFARLRVTGLLQPGQEETQFMF